jgi:hypothetical protein
MKKRFKAQGVRQMVKKISKISEPCLRLPVVKIMRLNRPPCARWTDWDNVKDETDFYLHLNIAALSAMS